MTASTLMSTRGHDDILIHQKGWMRMVDDNRHIYIWATTIKYVIINYILVIINLLIASALTPFVALDQSESVYLEAGQKVTARTALS